jgi:glyoxylase-like metal-dependent hydrolase (beta-lactamase superfamily II)
VLRQVADGVLVHHSDFLQTKSVVVQGATGVLLIDPGVQGDELACLANDLSESGQRVVAGFSTHPHWDHLLWHPGFGAAPRYGTARNETDARAFLADPHWQEGIAELIPSEVRDVPLDLLGGISGLPAGTARIPWEGPDIRILEHRAHAAGHAALLIEEGGVLVAGDMLSDALIPLLDFEAADPVDDYLGALRLLEDAAPGAEVVVPGHGSVGHADEVRARIDRDRAYLQALCDGSDPGDARLDPSGTNGDWLPGVHEWQAQQIRQREPQAATPE